MIKEEDVENQYNMIKAFTTGYSNMKEWDELTKNEKDEMAKRYKLFISELTKFINEGKQTDNKGEK